MIYHSSPNVNLNINLGGLSTSATIAINQLCRKMQRDGKDVYKLGLGQSPFPVPQPVVKALQENAHQKDYLAVKGLEELRQALIVQHQKAFDLDCNIEDIVVGPGSKELMFILQLVYDGEILLPMPAWVSYYPQAKIIGRHVNSIMTEKKDLWKITAKQIDTICRLDPNRPRLLILNYPSNPTGQTYSAQELEELAEVFAEYKVLVLSDEIYGKTDFSGKHASLVNYYPEGTIFSGGLSKWCGAGGWRLGVFIVPSAMRWLTDAMATVASETFTSTSAPIQYAAVSAFQENAEIDSYVDKCRQVLAALAADVYAQFKKTEVDVLPAQGGFYVFPDFSSYRERFEKRNIYTSRELCDTLLAETGVAILPGSDFGRAPAELNARLAYVDFNGEKALLNFPEDGNLDHTYLQKHCTRTVEAIGKITEWLNAL